MTAGGLSDPSKMPHVIVAKYMHNECRFFSRVWMSGGNIKLLASPSGKIPIAQW